MSDTCKYCLKGDTDEESCPDFCNYPQGEFGHTWWCTRPIGHEGLHIACGVGEHEMFTWGMKKEEEKNKNEKKEVCSYCLRGGEICASWESESGGTLPYICTREARHSGDHIACGSGTFHHLANWPNV